LIGFIGTTKVVPCYKAKAFQVFQQVPRAFSQLYDAREFSDYDVVDSGGAVKFSWASDWVDMTKLAFDAWDRVKSTDEAKLFLASLIFGNKRARPSS